MVPANYEDIRKDNQQRYGTDIGRIGHMLLADRYDDRTHFIFELLQNAEDALRRRGDWKGPRHVSFIIEPGCLKLSHFGRPFDDPDVRGVCGIAESTKDHFSIGRFGIGFKSVYTFTDRPEIHSGEENFAVEKYVSPVGVPPVAREADETLIILPLKQEDITAEQEIVEGFKRLGPGALLFLREIEEINWSVSGGETGFYQRSMPEPLGQDVHRVMVIGQTSGGLEVDQSWLVFHRNVFSAQQEKVGQGEVAFLLEPDKESLKGWRVSPVPTSPLVVFFPTVVETNLGFLIQGPYKTTPSRDNINRQEPWNKHLVEQTAELMVQAMRWLRDMEMLDVSALRCLPMDREKFSEGSKFESLFAAVRHALLGELLLPRHDGGYVSASCSKLARTQDVRELFSPQQVGQLFNTEEADWLTGDITQDRAPEIRQYLMRELGVTEVTPEAIVPRMTQSFLEAQPDAWIARLYEFLNGQLALRRRLDGLPLVRLSDGRQVVARINGEPKAFLPSDFETGFPTVSQTVCANPEARSFLVSLGITEPDLVDDVVFNVLQKYRNDTVDVDQDQYAKDISRIVQAFKADSTTEGQKRKLLAALRDTNFVMVVDAGDGKDYVAKPGEVYIATERLKQLFDGVSDVMIVNDAYPSLRGIEVRDLLEACGALRCPRPLAAPNALSDRERLELRREAGHEETSGVNDQVTDWLLLGFDKLIEMLPTLSCEQRAERGRLLWESLSDLEERRGRGVFEGNYKWTHYGSYSKEFSSAFVRRLNKVAWVSDANGELHPPPHVIFDSLDWQPNPFLLSKIQFKPPILEQLAREAGIDPAALDLLRQYGITSVEDLKSRLGIFDVGADEEKCADVVAVDNPNSSSTGDVYDEAKDLYGDDMPEIPPGTPDADGGDFPSGSRGGPVGGNLSSLQGGGAADIGNYRGSKNNVSGGKAVGLGEPIKRAHSTGHGSTPFISYVGTHPNDDEVDPDGIDHAARMRIEEQAIAKIIQIEPILRRTPQGNPGYDLYEPDAAGNAVRWVEVKSMTGGLEDRPVGLSSTQFDFAREKREAYWLYVVEYADDSQRARLLRIKDPAGQASTYTFDKGWTGIAATEPLLTK
jgi:hypothetical protein